MPDIPPRQVTPPVDDSAADLGTLVDLGIVEDQPEPQAPQPPATPEPEPPATPEPDPEPSTPTE